MGRNVIITGAILLAMGLALFLWKTLGLDTPLLPTEVGRVWRVDLEVHARGEGQRGSVSAQLPSSGPGQQIHDERTRSGGLSFQTRSEDGQRVGVWSGVLRGAFNVSHSFRVELTRVDAALDGSSATTPAEIADRYTQATSEYPTDSPEIKERLATLDPAVATDPADWLREIFAFVSDEISTADRATDDALLTLRSREGDATGNERLLVTLLRASQIPARNVAGLELSPDLDPTPVVWSEAYVGGGWVPLSSSRDFFASKPERFLTLATDTTTPIVSSGVTALTYRYSALRERLRHVELTAMMTPSQPILRSLSLYRLPVRTQSALRALLLLPLGCLVVAIFRNLVGVPTFGTFMPILIAFALREASLGVGLAMVGGVIGIGILGRLVLDKLHLLLVPRLSILLCVVVITVLGLAIGGGELATGDLTKGVLFPIVILTMLIERFSVTIAEEGMRNALVRAGWSVLVAIMVYPLFRSTTAEHLLFGYPELVFCITGILVWIGGYTGYRLADLIRFRTFADPDPLA